MDTIIEIIVNNDFIKSVVSIVSFILGIPTFIINSISTLPSEITTLLGTALIIIIALFLYRFVR